VTSHPNRCRPWDGVLRKNQLTRRFASTKNSSIHAHTLESTTEWGEDVAPCTHVKSASCRKYKVTLRKYGQINGAVTVSVRNSSPSPSFSISDSLYLTVQRDHKHIRTLPALSLRGPSVPRYPRFCFGKSGQITRGSASSTRSRIRSREPFGHSISSNVCWNTYSTAISLLDLLHCGLYIVQLYIASSRPCLLSQTDRPYPLSPCP